jgi:hypothetical protein
MADKLLASPAPPNVLLLLLLTAAALAVQASLSRCVQCGR